MAEKILEKIITVNSREKAVKISHYLHINYKVVANQRIVGPNLYEVTCQCENQKQVSHYKEVAKAILYGLNTAAGRKEA